MVIVLVVDSFADKSNGTSMTAFRFSKALQDRGHIVRVVAPYIKGENYFTLKERYIPIVTEVSHKQHMIFAKPDEKILKEAFSGADVVHLFLPFKLEKVAMKIAKEMKIPYMAAFHLPPGHIAYNIGLQKVQLFNKFIFWWFKKTFYDKVNHIHCPSELIKNEIEREGYKAKKFVISNGFDPQFAPPKEPLDSDGFIHISMVGRYSPEKRQDLIIKAIAKNPYKDKIKLHLKGIGPLESKLKRLAKILPNGADIGFAEQDELEHILHSSYLYIHASDVEAESIACLEAISCGVVPIISDSKISATSQFALDSRSLFKAGNSDDLSQKITYWIENQKEREIASTLYAKSALNYTLESSIKKTEEMYQEVIEFYKSHSCSA